MRKVIKYGLKQKINKNFTNLPQVRLLINEMVMAAGFQQQRRDL